MYPEVWDNRSYFALAYALMEEDNLHGDLYPQSVGI